MTTDRGTLSEANRGLQWLYQQELLWLILCTPFLLFPGWMPALTVAALLALPLLWLIRWHVQGRLTRPLAMDWAILGLMIALATGLLVTPRPSLSLPKASGLLLGISFYYGVLNHPAGRWLPCWAPWLSLGIALLSLVGIDWVAFKWPLLTPIYRRLPSLIHGVPRTMSGGFHPNEVGGTLAMCLPWLIGLALAKAGAMHKGRASQAARGRLARVIRWGSWPPLLGISLLSTIVVLILTQSRTALAAALIAVSVTLVVHYRWWRLAAVGILIVGVIVAWALLARDAPADWALLPGSHTWQARPEIWRNAVNTLRDYPFTGIGLNAFAPVSRERYTYVITPATWDFVHAHNIWLQTAVDLGGLGLLSFVAIVGLFFQQAVCLLSRRTATPSRIPRSWRAAAVGSLVAYLAFGAIDAITLGAKPGLILWWTLGWVAAIHTHQKTETDQVSAGRPLSRWLAAGLLGVAIAGLLLSPAYRALLYRNLGNVALNQNKLDQAVNWLNRALALRLTNRRTRWALGEAYVAAGREDAALLTWRAGEIPPQALVERGAALRRARALKEAERWHRWALIWAPTSSNAWYGLGQTLQAQDRPADALEAYQRALRYSSFAAETHPELDLDRAQVQHALGIALVRQADLEAAAHRFQAIIDENADDVAAYFNLGQTRALQGDHQAAHRALSQALATLEEQKRTLAPLRYRELRLEIAIALTTNANRRQDVAAAEHWAQEAHALEPRHAYPYADLAELYVAKERYEAALEEIGAYLEQGMRAPGMLYLAGEAFRGLGYYDKAIDAYQTAIQGYPQSGTFYAGLAEAYAGVGNDAAAESAWAKAKDLGIDASFHLTGHSRFLEE
jgi:tetratricopeptide (TPR) repeat protein/O-antigen ligase